MQDSDLTNLFLLGRLRQGQRQEALQVEQLNLLREARGLPPIERQPMIDGFWAAVMFWCFRLVVIGFIGMMALFALGILYIIVNALLFGIPDGSGG